MQDHVKLLSCACEPERSNAECMLKLSEIRRKVWGHLPTSLQTELDPAFAAVAAELGRVEELRVRARAAESLVRHMKERRVPRYPNLVDPKQGNSA